MQAGFRPELVLLAFLLSIAGFACQRGTKPSETPPAKTSQARKAPVQSGVYGFSGARVGDSESREGVVGECIWIYDAHNQKQVAKGDCYENDPGKFRVPLDPGHYVVRGPGGNTPIDVPNGGWAKVESIVRLPMAP